MAIVRPPPDDRRGVVDAPFAQHAGGAVIRQVLSDDAVTEQERSAAIEKKARLMEDPAWVDRYNNGGAAEKREMLLLNILASSKVRSAA